MYSFGAADIIAGDAIEVAIKKIEKTDGVLIYQAEHLDKAQEEIDRLRLVIDGHEEEEEEDDEPRVNLIEVAREVIEEVAKKQEDDDE